MKFQLISIPLLSFAVIDAHRLSRRSIPSFSDDTNKNDPTVPTKNNDHDLSVTGEEVNQRSMRGHDRSLKRSSSSSKSKKSNSSNNKPDRPSKAFDQCYDSCGLESPFDVEWYESEDALDDKPSCCKGGVSGFKVTFEGQDGTRLLMYHALDGEDVNDPCPEDKKDYTSDRSAVFVNCDNCFPDEYGSVMDGCDVTDDAKDEIIVNRGDFVCVMAFDPVNSQLTYEEKLPTNFPFYFQDVDMPADAVTITTIHTSCSHPIYAPYAWRLGTCNDDPHRFIESSSTIQASHAYFFFYDAISAKWPGTLISNCGDSDPDKTNCCDGGASFLRLRFSGTESSGLLSLNKFNAVTVSPCLDYYEYSSTHSVRFVPCDEPCISAQSSPLNTSVACLTSLDSIHVIEDQEVCLGSWNEDTQRIAFDQKLPTNLPVYFLPTSGDEVLFAANLHTSCSKPLGTPYAQPFSDPCTESVERPVVLEGANGYDGMRLTFVDGVSKGWVKTLAENDLDPTIYNITFSDCSCKCDDPGPCDGSSSECSGITETPTTSPTLAPTGQPTSSPSNVRTTPIPSSAPTFSPTFSPSDVPSSRPTSLSATEQPGPVEPPTVDCSLECGDWITENCVFREGLVQSGQACDVTMEVEEQDEQVDTGEKVDGRELFRKLKTTLADSTTKTDSMAPHAKAKHHAAMISIYTDLLKQFG